MSPPATGYNQTSRMTIPFQSRALCFSLSVWAFQSASIAKAMRRLPRNLPATQDTFILYLLQWAVIHVYFSQSWKRSLAARSPCFADVGCSSDTNEV
jgi:hypothetical protein